MKISKITIKQLFGIKEWQGDGKNIELSMGQYSFATNLKKERTNRGITQHELATGVHVAQNTVSDWEQCKSYPSIDKIYDIANFLKIPVSKLISDVQKNGCKADCTQKNNFF